MRGKMKKRIFVCLMVFLTTVVSNAVAQKIEVLDEMVVTATKTEEQRKDIPNSVILIDEFEILESPATSLGDLLGGKTGLDWRTRGDFGAAGQELHIRGMGGDGTQVLVNGLSINSPSLGSADIGDISLNSIGKIEVVKGSGSVLYGSGAMGGTVNILTKDPTRGKTDLHLTAGYGTEDTYRASAEHGRFMTENFGYYFTLNGTGTDGFRDNSDGDQKDVSAKLILDNGPYFKASLFADYMETEGGRPGPKPPAGTELFTVGGTPVYNSDAASLLNELSEENTHVILKIETHPIERLGIHFQADYTDMVSENYSRYYNAFEPGNLPGSRTEVVNEVLGIEGYFDFEFFKGSSILAGFQHKEYDWSNHTINLDGFGDPSSLLDGKADLHTTGVFGEIQYRPCDYFKAIVGVRQEDHSTFGKEVLPRYGFVINPTDDMVIKANTGRHFKAPTPNDLFWPYEDWGWGMGAQGNADLKPETGWHSDIGLEQALLNRTIFLSLSWFKWDIEDKIEWVPDASYFYRPENLSKYESQGWEAGIVISPVKQMKLSLDYTYTDAQEQKQGGVKRSARYTAENFFKAAVTYWFDYDIDITAILRYTGDRPAIYGLDTDKVPEEELSSYWTIDLKANKKIGDNWTLSCRINNLLDEDYDTYAETFYDQAGTSTLSRYPGSGRSMFVSVDYSF